MATKVILVRTDDIDGTPADRTVPFGIDRVDYEIDLSTANAARLTKLFAPYMAAGRKQGQKGLIAFTQSQPTTQGAGNA